MRAAGGRPGRLGERCGARKRLVFDAAGQPHVLGPRIDLGAEDAARLGRREFRGNRLEVVDVRERHDARPPGRLARRVALPVVEVQDRRRRHHDVVPGARRRDSAGSAAPGHDGRTRGNAALEDFVPADQPASARVEEPADARDEPALERRLVCETELADARLHARRRPPAVLDRLVAAHVDEFAGEQVDHFVEDVLEEYERRFVGIEEPVVHAPVGRDRGGAARAEPRVARDRRLRVAGHLDLGDDRHEARRRVRNEFAHLGLRVEAAVRRGIAGAGGLAPGADARELRILENLEPPALVVGQVPVQDVQLVQRHPVDKLPDELGRLVMPRGIEHEPAPGEARRIRDRHGRHVDACRARRIGGEQLPQRDRAVEKAARTAGGDGNPLGGHNQRITFIFGGGLASPKLEIDGPSAARADSRSRLARQRDTARALEKLDEILCDRIAGRTRDEANLRLRRELERAGSAGDFSRCRNDRNRQIGCHVPCSLLRATAQHRNHAERPHGTGKLSHGRGPTLSRVSTAR